MRVGFLGAGLIATYHGKSLRRSGAELAHSVGRAGFYDPDRSRAEVFDDWLAPVGWTDSDGTERTLQGATLTTAAHCLVDGSLDPDGGFIDSVVHVQSAFPDFATTLQAHAVVQAIYDSAALGGASQSPLAL